MLLILFIACGLWTLGDAQISGDPADGTCLCVVFTGVNVRDTACGNVIGSANPPQCYQYLGSVVNCVIGTTAYNFYQVQFGAREGWMAGDYLSIGNPSQCSSSNEPWPWQPGTCANIDIVSRSEWGARPAQCFIPSMAVPVNYLFIHHTVTSACYDQAACTAQMQAIQAYHMDSNGWCDIGYNYLIGEDGRAYEGRGWNLVGAHTQSFNDIAVAISVIGDYTSRRPSDTAMLAIQNLINCCQIQNIVVTDFKLNGHRDANPTACPGDTLYPEIQTWPYYCFDVPTNTNPGAACTSRP